VLKATGNEVLFKILPDPAKSEIESHKERYITFSNEVDRLINALRRNKVTLMIEYQLFFRYPPQEE
jgi:uncharacterized protein YaaN involved in tellurite resistance